MNVMENERLDYSRPDWGLTIEQISERRASLSLWLIVEQGFNACGIVPIFMESEAGRFCVYSRAVVADIAEAFAFDFDSVLLYEIPQAYAEAGKPCQLPRLSFTETAAGGVFSWLNRRGLFVMLIPYTLQQYLQRRREGCAEFRKRVGVWRDEIAAVKWELLRACEATDRKRRAERWKERACEAHARRGEELDGVVNDTGKDG